MSVSTMQSREGVPRDRVIQTTVARTPDEAERLRPWFDRFQPINIDADLDLVLTVSRVCDGVAPHITLCELADERAILLVGRVEQERPSNSRRGPGLRTLRLAFGGVIGVTSYDDCRLVIDMLSRTLAAGEADVVALQQLDAEGQLYATVSSAIPWWRADHVPKHQTHWRSDMPDSVEAFLRARSSTTRSSVRRYRKKVDAAHGSSLSIREFRDAADLKSLCLDVESIAASTYQRGLGVGYTGDPLQVALMTLGAEQGWLRAWVLYLSNDPVAYWFGYTYAGTFYSVANGFIPEYGDLRVGQYLQMEMINRLCNEADVTTFDWGRGEAEHKRRFGDHAIAEVDIMIYAPSFRAGRANAARTLRAAVARVARASLSHTPLFARVKKARRARAQKRAKSQAT